MKKLFSLLGAALFLSLFSNTVHAQCTGTHFRDFLYADSVQSDVVYGSNVNYNWSPAPLTLDLHFPQLDPNPHGRPLIIWMHGGNFIDGDKTGDDVVPLCRTFTKMGYVTASINYRLGIDSFPYNDSASVTRSLLRVVQDARAAVRFFRKSFANGNPYGIDTSMIFMGGVSVGALAAADLAYLTNRSDYPGWCDSTKDGGLANCLEGASGNPGYPSNVKAVISISGGVGDTSWIHAGSTPILCLHGDSDRVIPYNRGRLNLLNTDTAQNVYGGHAILLRASHVGLTNCFYEYVGQGHIPEVADSAFMDTTLNLTRNFLIHFVCGDAMACKYEFPLSVKELSARSISMHCYPNPAGSFLTIDLSQLSGEGTEINLYNAMGQEVRKYAGIRDSRFTIERGDLPNGLYLIDALVKGRRYTARVVFN